MSKLNSKKTSGKHDTKKQKRVVISEKEMPSTATPESTTSLPRKSSMKKAGVIETVKTNDALKKGKATREIEEEGTLKNRTANEEVRKKGELKKGNAVEEVQEKEIFELAAASTVEDEVFLTGFDEGEGDDSSDDDDEEEFNQTSQFASKDLPDSCQPLTKKSKQKVVGETGVIYLGRIPHGFHEEEMTSYFSQFGDVIRLRLSRSRRTGNSKHYGFIEFKHREVAEIVAETLHNYLLCGNMLQCKLMDKDDIHPRLWVGCGKKFRNLNNRLSREMHNQEKMPAQQTAISNRLIRREERKRKRFAELGIEYEFSGHCNGPVKVQKPETTKKPKKMKPDAATTVAESEKLKAKKAPGIVGRPKRKSM